MIKNLSEFTNSPFIKVEASSYTEVGYHGKDITTVIQDLIKKTKRSLEQKLNDMKSEIETDSESFLNLVLLEVFIGHISNPEIRSLKLRDIQNCYYDERYLFVPNEIISINSVFQNFEEYFVFLNGIYPKLAFGFETDSKRVTVRVFKNIMRSKFVDNLDSLFDIKKMTKTKTENEGIVFIDEIDKIIRSNMKHSNNSGPSTDGVQRDLLPIVDGTKVKTDVGFVSTKHMLFLSAGAFSQVTPSDMMPELLGEIILGGFVFGI